MWIIAGLLSHLTVLCWSGYQNLLECIDFWVLKHLNVYYSNVFFNYWAWQFILEFVPYDMVRFTKCYLSFENWHSVAVTTWSLAFHKYYYGWKRQLGFMIRYFRSVVHSLDYGMWFTPNSPSNISSIFVGLLESIEPKFSRLVMNSS